MVNYIILPFLRFINSQLLLLI